MHDQPDITVTIFEGWHTYQSLLITALAPLSAEQLALSTAPDLRTIDAIVRHMIGARGRWCNDCLGESGQAMADFSTWDRRGSPNRTAVDLVQGLETSLADHARRHCTMEPCRVGDDLSWRSARGEPEIITRPWVIWHLIEHDLHHGGEVSLTLGSHGLAVPDM